MNWQVERQRVPLHVAVVEESGTWMGLVRRQLESLADAGAVNTENGQRFWRLDAYPQTRREELLSANRWGPALVVVELDAARLVSDLSFVAALTQRRRTVVAVGDPCLAPYRWAIRQAGAQATVTSILGLSKVAEMAAALCRRPIYQYVDWKTSIWQRLPWGAGRQVDTPESDS